MSALQKKEALRHAGLVLMDARVKQRLLTVALSTLGILAVPPLFTGSSVPLNSAGVVLTYYWVCWSALLRVSVVPLTLALIVSTVCAKKRTTKPSSPTDISRIKSSTMMFPISLRGASLLVVTVLCTSQLQMITPSWLWNPFLLWNGYRIYRPSVLKLALEGVCTDRPYPSRDPLCLSSDSWNTLSSGALASDNAVDVEMVERGAQYIEENSAGLIIGVLARDAADSVEALRMNAESLAPLFNGKLTVVIFENDSVDGTRGAIAQWAAQHDGYGVDLMTCGDEYPDCKFGSNYRYDVPKGQSFTKSSGVGRMAEYRQRMVDHILSHEDYRDYTHFLVTDLDLQVSLSPLGILHSLGSTPDNPVASSGKMPYPGSLGSVMLPYDIGAFRVADTPLSTRLNWLHTWFCGLRPPSDRWRNMCDAPCPLQLMNLLLSQHMSPTEPYPVKSAFNGATLYPMALVRSSQATYDAGEFGQRNEHIGFHYSLDKQMFVNPKWSMNVSPARPAGPQGIRALRTNLIVITDPVLSACIFLQIFVCAIVFVYGIVAISLYVICPFCDSFSLKRKRRRTLITKKGPYSTYIPWVRDARHRSHK